QVAPERGPPVAGVALQIGRRHGEGKHVRWNATLAAVESGLHERVDLLDLDVAHGVTAYGDAVAVDHQERAGATLGAVVGIGESEIEGAVIGAVALQLRPANDVEPFRRLAVTFAQLRAEF